ncbi:MAG: sigma-70 family RNA polymerase sigma factor [Polyangiaceae bacterium]
MSLELSTSERRASEAPEGPNAAARPSSPPSSHERPRPSPEDARLRAILQENYAFIWRQLRRFGVPESRVDDAAQEVFVVASQKLSAIREGSERSYLFGTALRVASQMRRSAVMRHEVGVSTPPEMAAIASQPDELLDRGRARALLDAVLDSLDDDVRAVFVLYELEELETKEIAELLGIPAGTVASRLRRGREAFEAKVSRLFPKGARP